MWKWIVSLIRCRGKHHFIMHFLGERKTWECTRCGRMFPIPESLTRASGAFTPDARARGSRIDESRHLLATEHGGQLHGDPGKGQIVKGQIATLERLAVEEPQSRHTILDGAGRRLFLLEQGG